MNPLSRMLIAFFLGLVVYALYWITWRHRFKVPPFGWRWSRTDRSLRQGPRGIARVFFGWVLAFVTYAMVIEDEGIPFTLHWWQETLLAGDWIGVILFATVMTFAESYRASQYPLSLSNPQKPPTAE